MRGLTSQPGFPYPPSTSFPLTTTSTTHHPQQFRYSPYINSRIHHTSRPLSTIHIIPVSLPFHYPPSTAVPLPPIHQFPHSPYITSPIHHPHQLLYPPYTTSLTYHPHFFPPYRPSTLLPLSTI